ncbi:MAG: MtnX-like HAD-IB family phosphatase [Firmicutes bacterium]|nr:MtnX-like HAD-IB family phosphatase [Bacillota bacterium]
MAIPLERLDGPLLAGKRVVILADFDGTVSMRDVQVSYLDKYARPDWRQAEAKILAEGKKSAHYLPVIYKGFRASREELLGFIDAEMRLDPDFPGFVAFCRDHGFHLEITSDGLDFYIRFLLAKYGVEVPFISNRADFGPEGVRLSHPYFNAGCGKCGSCKKSRLERLRGPETIIIYVGNLSTDLCPAQEADIVFAKAQLLSFCRQERIPCIPFEGFADVRRTLEKFLYLAGSVDKL